MTARATPKPRRSQGRREHSSSCSLLSGREASIEAFALLCHVEKQLGGGKALAIFLLQALAERDEVLRPHHVEESQRAPGERREAPAEDRADVGLANVGDDALLEDAGRFD